MDDEFVKIGATCPHCGSKTCEDQPHASLHCFTLIYMCGYEVDAAISHPNTGTVSVNCTMKPE